MNHTHRRQSIGSLFFLSATALDNNVLYKKKKHREGFPRESYDGFKKIIKSSATAKYNLQYYGEMSGISLL